MVVINFVFVMAVVINRNPLRRDIPKDLKVQHRLEVNTTLEKIRLILNRSQPLTERIFTRDALVWGWFERILVYRCKKFHGQPLILKFWIAQEFADSPKGYVSWNREIYQLDAGAFREIKQLFLAKEEDRLEEHYRGMIKPDAPFMDGNKFEVVYNPSSAPVEKSFWDRWETDAYDAFEIYQSRIYPVFCDYVSYLLKKNLPSVRILDIGAGSGVLAKQILEENSDQIQKHFLLEYNEAEVAIARQRLQDRIIQGRVEIHQGDAMHFDSMQRYMGTGVNIIIACGLLTKQVLASKKDALTILHHITRIAPSGCYLILSGLGPSYISSEDLHETGWRVKNTYSHQAGRSFYVAVRSSNKQSK